MRKQLESLLPNVTKANLMLKAFSLTKVPLLFLTGCKVIEMNKTTCKLKMPFKKIVKNHLGSVYFGALSIGADACIGTLATQKIYESNHKINLIFKSFNAQFLKRAMGSTIFICEEGLEIESMVEKAISSKERVNQVITAFAVVGDEKVAEFKLELSLKLK
jgi:acyl-coenzyme A thioesterase PaaI-like protein